MFFSERSDFAEGKTTYKRVQRTLHSLTLLSVLCYLLSVICYLYSEPSTLTSADDISAGT